MSEHPSPSQASEPFPTSEAGSVASEDISRRQGAFSGTTFQFALVVWGVSRLWHAIFAYLGHLSHPFQEKIPGAWEGVSSWWLNVWTTYDSFYFIDIAAHGYSPKNCAFFPLYSLLMSPFGPNQNALAFAGVLLSNLTFLGALVVFYELSRLDLSETLARRSTWVLALFPAGVFSLAVYTESLFLLLALISFYAARRGAWWVAGTFGFLASLTRNSGPILTAALAAQWFVQRKTWRNDWLSLLPVVLPMLAFVGVQFYFRREFGEAGSSLAVQRAFGRALSWPFVPIWRDVLELFRGGGFNLIVLLNCLASILVFVFAWVFRHKLPVGSLVFMVGVMLAQLTFSRTWPPYTISSLRYVFSTWAFAQSIAMGVEAVPRPFTRRTLAGAGLLLTALVAYLFGTKAFVS